MHPQHFKAMIYEDLDYVCLMHVLGATQATRDTVNLFNSVRREQKDKHGRYIIIAVEPYKNGLLTRKKYLFRNRSTRLIKYVNEQKIQRILTTKI